MRESDGERHPHVKQLMVDESRSEQRRKGYRRAALTGGRLQVAEVYPDELRREIFTGVLEQM